MTPISQRAVPGHGAGGMSACNQPYLSVPNTLSHLRQAADEAL